MQITKSELLAYQNRWKAVAEAEAEELRQTSLADRWRQLNAVMRMAAGLDILQEDSDDSEQIIAVRERWNRLKDRYVAKV